MKKNKWLCSIGMAVLLTAILTAVSANARSIDWKTIPENVVQFVRVGAYLDTHPQIAANTIEGLTTGHPEVAEQYFTDPEQRDYVNRIAQLTVNIGDVGKTAAITVNPQNSERNQVPTIRITGKTYPVSPKRSNASRLTEPTYTLLTINVNNGNKIPMDTFLAYKDKDDNLVVWGILANDNSNKIQVSGLSSIQLTTKDKVLAEGTPTQFETPMILSPRRVGETSSGVKNGYPDRCFIKLVFEPGTYDNNIDISELDNLNSTYTLDYTVIQ